MSTLDTQQSSFTVSSYPNCYLFLNWHYNPHESEDERAVVFRSLVATVKIHPALDASLEAKAVKFLKSAIPYRGESADAFLSKFASSSDNSSSDFIQSIVVLISSSKHAIATASMEFLSSLLHFNSTHFRLTFVKADLLPKLITTLNPLSLSFTKAVDIHTHLVKSLRQSVRISSPRGLAELEIEDLNEQRAVHETVLKQVVVPSEKYICHLCVNRFSIVDGGLSETFLELLARLFWICPYYQPTMKFVLHMPVVLTIPSCLAYIVDNCSIWSFLFDMNNAQREWNQTRGEQRQMWKILHRQLRMEGIEDVIDAKLRNSEDGMGETEHDQPLFNCYSASHHFQHVLSLRGSRQRDSFWSLEIDIPRSPHNIHSRHQPYRRCSHNSLNHRSVSAFEGLWVLGGSGEQKLLLNDLHSFVATTDWLEPSLATREQPAVLAKTIGISGEERDLLLVCASLSEMDQSILTIDRIFLASEYSSDQNFVFTTPFSFPASAFPRNPIGVAAYTVVVEDGIVRMGGRLDGDELRPFWTFWKVSELALNLSNSKCDVQRLSVQI
ncbi:hypothetical protein BLNAU_1025 [Blattamonas nauphoetae]|uniref:Uncharacterized protein n=1 Tax=Blattamonas nauphoetae TaxID=2049346 RepID=A0ABQ9YJK9_9EUKA|nr:hypothetical protein BLNAU_1025 [Blattamonas nauphoetae]